MFADDSASTALREAAQVLTRVITYANMNTTEDSMITGFTADTAGIGKTRDVEGEAFDELEGPEQFSR